MPFYFGILEIFVRESLSYQQRRAYKVSQRSVHVNHLCSHFGMDFNDKMKLVSPIAAQECENLSNKATFVQVAPLTSVTLSLFRIAYKLY